MNIVKATKRFESFLREHGDLLPADLAAKHRLMCDGEFPFLRATFYRWAQRFPVVCPELAAAPRVLGVGDLHVENFGTWRDAEGRLVWGINDFDEACKLPYTNDLLRLAVSAMLAVESGRLQIKSDEICGAILDGYRQGIRGDGDPFVLAERHNWLGELASDALKEPAKFWERLSALPPIRKRPPRGAIAAVERLLPHPDIRYRLVRRTAGLGSLGKVRVVALSEWNGSTIAREAKAITPSAWYWAAGETTGELLYETILQRAVRCPDPCVAVRGRWIVRRLAPDCGRVELATLTKALQAERLLHAMGRETANIHLGSPKAIRAVRRDLAKRRAGWLCDAAQQMAGTVRADWKQWKQTTGGTPAGSATRKPA
jgi:hypothetical protein